MDENEKYVSVIQEPSPVFLTIKSCYNSKGIFLKIKWCHHSGLMSSRFETEKIKFWYAQGTFCAPFSDHVEKNTLNLDNLWSYESTKFAVVSWK